MKFGIAAVVWHGIIAMAAVSFHLSDQSKLAESWACEPPLTVGRQDRGEPEWGPFEGVDENLLIVAPITSLRLPRIG